MTQSPQNPDSPELATTEDVVRYGFGEGAGPFTMRRIAENVEAATGKSAHRIAELLTRLLDAELIEPARVRCFALTEKGVSAYGPARTSALGRIILETVPSDECFDVDRIASALSASPDEIRSEIGTLLDAGAIHDIGEGLLEGPHYLKDPSADTHVALEVLKCGPALRKALSALRRPMSQRELATAMKVTRERARQVTQALVARNLVSRKHDPELGTLFQTRTEALQGLGHADMAA